MTASDTVSESTAQTIPAVAIALVGAATLLFEILLTRIFSVTMWYHFAFVAISLALLGIAASGVAVSVAPRFFRRERSAAQIGAAAAALAVTAVVSFLIDLRIPLVPFDVPGQEGPSWRAYGFLFAKFVVLALPFFASGLAVALAFTHFPRRVHRTYFADLAGGGGGCLLVVPLLRSVSAPSAVMFVAALAFLAAALIWRRGGQERAAVAAASGVLASLLLMGLNESFRLVGVDRVKSYGASEVQVVERPKLYERWHPVSRVAVHPFELSGNPKEWFYGRDKNIDFPPVLEVTNDGGARTFLYPEMDAEDRRRFFRYDVSDQVYALTERPDVLVVGVGGGKDVLSALAFDARHVVAVELNPLMIDVVQEKFAAFTGAPYDDPRVEIAIDEGRNYIASRPARHDVIKISATDTWAAAAVGAYALTENYLYTVEALEAFLAHLKPDGYLSIVRWYPFESLRLAVMTEDVLRRSGVAVPEDRVLMVRNEQTLNLIIKNGTFTAAEVESVRSQAREAGLVLLDGARESRTDPADETHRFLDGLHRTALRAAENAGLEQATPFRLDPPSDDRPFFFNAVGLGNVDDRRYYDFAGYAFQHGRGLSLLLGLLKVSIVVALVFVVAPFVLASGRPWAGVAAGVRTAASFYFLMLGLGYLLIEIPMLQQFILFLGHPTYAVTVVLFSLLVSSGVGSLLADRLPGAGQWTYAALFGVLVVFLTACVLGLPGFLHAAIGLPFAVRVLLSVALIVPVGLLLGMPFPTGLRMLHGRGATGLVPWAWAVNGAASVAAPVLATAVAILWGFSRAFYLGILCYVVAGGLLWTLRESAGDGTARPDGA